MAIDTAQSVLDSVSNLTDQQLADAKDVLDQAVVRFKNNKVEQLTGVSNVALVVPGIHSTVPIMLQAGESLSLQSSNESVATVIEGPSGVIQVTAVAAGDSIITVQVKKDGQVIKTGTFTVTVTAVNPMSITSKAITNLDFSTVPATRATIVSKPVTESDYTGNEKEFDIVIGSDRITIELSWALPTNFTTGEAVGSVVDSYIQDFYYQKDGANGIMNRPLEAYGVGDTFQIRAREEGAASSFELEGTHWEEFFGQSSVLGTDANQSKNSSFTISDGTNTATISLVTTFTTLDMLITTLNRQLRDANVQATVEKVGALQFKITSTTGILVIYGTDKADFF